MKTVSLVTKWIILSISLILIYFIHNTNIEVHYDQCLSKICSLIVNGVLRGGGEGGFLCRRSITGYCCHLIILVKKIQCTRLHVRSCDHLSHLPQQLAGERVCREEAFALTYLCLSTSHSVPGRKQD